MSEPLVDRAWWVLNLRNARGESLSVEERTIYEAGLQKLEALEHYPGDLEELRRLMAEMTRLLAKQAELEALSARLGQQIVELEAKLGRRAREPLDVEVAQLSEDAVREADQWERQE